MTTLSTFFAEAAPNRSVRAEVRETANVMSVAYFDKDNILVREETHPGKSRQAVETLAESWALNVQQLNG